MYVLILDGQIAGIADVEVSGFTAIPAPNGFDTSTWYYDPVNETVKPIPPRPEPVEGHQWEWQKHQWVSIPNYVPPSTVITLPDEVVTPADILLHPLTVQAFEQAKTDTHLLALLVEMLAGWVLNPKHAETVLPKVLERMGLTPDGNVITLSGVVK